MRSVLAFSVTAFVAALMLGSGRAESPRDNPALGKELTNSIGMKLVLIPAGEFMMGAPEADRKIFSPASGPMPQHKVKISRPFYMGVYEITNKQFEKISGKIDRAILAANDPDFPMQGVAWDDAVRFCRRLSELPEEKKAGRVYRLPTEAEWEYACRANTTSRFHYGDSLSIEQASFDHQRPFPYDGRKGPSLKQPMKVGSFKPNAFGLYDMHGNIREWCSDWWTDEFKFEELTVDPQGPVGPPEKNIGDRLNKGKVRRGGSYRWDAFYAHSACRSSDSIGWRDMPDDGFRVVVSVPQPTEVTVEPAAKKGPVTLDKPIANSIGMKLQLLPPGTFLMGSPDSEKLREERQEDLHEVELTKPFHIGVYELTQEEYEKVMGKNPSYFGPKGQWIKARKDLKGLKPEDLKRHPVESVSWEDATAFCKKLSELPEEKKAGRTYRLPSEAEWEYACRAGTMAPFSFGATLSRKTQASFRSDVIPCPYDGAKEEPPLARTAAVGSYLPNPWGLYDMHGNVSEWCLDEITSAFYLTCPKKDPVYTSPLLLSFKRRRGGSWSYMAKDCRSASRSYLKADSSSNVIGFRVVMTIAATKP